MSNNLVDDFFDIRCPHCGHYHSQVVSRKTAHGMNIDMTLQCMSCLRYFSEKEAKEAMKK